MEEPSSSSFSLEEEEEEEEEAASLMLHRIAWGILGVSLPMFLILCFVLPAPYGKLLTKDDVWWHGPKVRAPLAWFLFESPNLIWAACCWQQHGRRTKGSSLANYILYGFFTLHYIQRGIYYPLCMSFTNSRPVPMLVILAAITFCTFNGYLQCRSLLLDQELPEDWIASWQFLLGLGLAWLGAFVNVRSDATLRALKKKRPTTKSSASFSSSNANNNSNNNHGQNCYQIPRGGLFEYCSAPHFLGEIVEWVGFAIACGGSLAPVSFVIYTMSNLIPRAMAQHAWYRAYFGDQYPENRTALIPFLF